MPTKKGLIHKFIPRNLPTSLVKTRATRLHRFPDLLEERETTSQGVLALLMGLQISTIFHVKSPLAKARTLAENTL